MDNKVEITGVPLHKCGDEHQLKNLSYKYTSPCMRRFYEHESKSTYYSWRKSESVQSLFHKIPSHLSMGGRGRLTSPNWTIKERGMQVSLTPYESGRKGCGDSMSSLSTVPTKRRCDKGWSRCRRLVSWRSPFSRATFTTAPPDRRAPRWIGPTSSGISENESGVPQRILLVHHCRRREYHRSSPEKSEFFRLAEITHHMGCSQPKARRKSSPSIHFKCNQSESDT